MRDAAGQATIEWVGLVLLAALVLGALAAFRAPAQDSGLGTALAKRITCAAGGACAPTRPAGLPAPGSLSAPALPHDRAVSRAKAVDAFRRLRGVGKLTNRIWIVCLGYRRFIYERDHVREPAATMPLEQALDIADDCLNPLSFGEDG